jgi:hypothetical protein
MEAVQVLVNMNIPFNRVGIPRRAIAMAQQLIDDSASPKWAWVVFSKGVYELLVWNDGSVVYWFGNSCRAKQTGLLKRSAPGGIQVCFVDSPEAPWAYNTFGRSGVDGQDQGRKEQQTSSRRTLRAGTKGALFGVDVAITNAWIAKKFLQTESGLQKYRNETITKNEFLAELATKTLTTVTARRRVSKSCGCKRAWDNVAPVYDPLDNGHALGHHILVDRRAEAIVEWKAGNKVGTKPNKKGKCKSCRVEKKAGRLEDGTTLHCTTFCAGCNDWYHLGCYNIAHMIGDVPAPGVPVV